MGFIDLLFTLLFLNGYGVYAPTCTDFPMLDEKKDVRLDVSPLLQGMRATVSYGVSDNFLVQADASYNYSRYYGQMAGGWYHNYDNKVVEVLGGASLGYGRTRNIWKAFDEPVMGNYATCFLQGNFGWKDVADLHIDVAVGVKGGYYNSLLSYYGGKDVGWVSDERYGSFFLEPNAVFRFGWEKFRINLKLGYNIHQESPAVKLRDVMCNYLSTEFSLNYHF